MTKRLANWARPVLEAIRRRRLAKSVEKKLEATRAAAKYQFPISDIGQVLEEIERGYLVWKPQ